MVKRIDKYGHLLRVGDPVRLPSQQDGHVRSFVETHGRVRVIVQYESRKFDEVTLLPHLLERLRWKHVAQHKNRVACRGAGRVSNRPPRGESHYRATLTDAQVRQMRKRRRETGIGYGALAIMFGCGVCTARDICTYRTRRSV